jgi:N-acetylmuramoyl-L-alanine amidase
MSMIEDGWLSYAKRCPTPNVSGIIIPKFIVMHYTAGWTAASAINTLMNPKSRASAHLVVDTDGAVTQLASFETKAWHAGPSKYMGHSGLNSYSIGIEIVNPGFLRAVAFDSNGNPSSFQDAYGSIKTAAKVGPVVASKSARAGSGMFYWPVYPDAQLNAVEEIVEDIFEQYPYIKDIVSHEEIDTRGWKTDPGPAFPMRRFKKIIDNRSEDMLYYEVTASSLNVRGGPGVSFSVIDKVKVGTVLPGHEERDGWMRISQDGWVHAGYLQEA